MKAKHITILLGILTMGFAACSDDLTEKGNEPVLNGKGIYFNIGAGHEWGENAATRSEVLAPIELKSSEADGKPLYLHTEVEATTPAVGEEVAETRGKRYTGDVFYPSSEDATKINSIGVYAKTSAGATIMDFVQLESFTRTTKDDGALWFWNEKNTNIQDVWENGVAATFYGYAPYFPNPSSTNGLSLALNDGVPVLTYVAPETVANQLDILTAKKTVTKTSDPTTIDLVFDHIMAAVKFKFARGKKYNPSSGAIDADKTDLIWNDGINDYVVTVKTVAVTDVYYTGTWEVGATTYANNGGSSENWSVDTSAGTRDFTYTSNKNLAGESGATAVEINPDADGYVFMMVPQTCPAGSQVVITCTVTPVSEGTTRDITLSAPLNTNSVVWHSGYTYNYTLSLDDFAYVFDFNTATTFSKKDASAVDYDGENYNIDIVSYKIDARGNKKIISWIPTYEIETEENSETQSTGSGSGGTEIKTGFPDWIKLKDNYGTGIGTYVEDTHVGTDGREDNERQFLLEVKGIQIPVKDLSLYNLDQTKKWTGRTTSNCYIVAGPGKYRIPLVYGNAILNGTDNKMAYQVAAIRSHPETASNNGSYDYLRRLINYAGSEINDPYVNTGKASSAKSVSDAKLLWEDVNGLITVTNDIDWTDYDGDVAEDGYMGYLVFTVNPEPAGSASNYKYGNAVVCVRDGSGNIMWSWHIWVTDPALFAEDNVTLDVSDSSTPHPYTYANLPIGMVESGKSVAASKRNDIVTLTQEESGKIITIDIDQLRSAAFTTSFTNVLYQWGRKDPMRGITSSSDNGKDTGQPRYHELSSYTNSYGNQATIPTLIKNPNTIYGTSDGDLYLSMGTNWDHLYNLWGIDCNKAKLTYNFYGKTIYDPSPVGYCVPPSKAFSKLSSRRSNWPDKSKAMPTISEYNQDAKTLKFHGVGCRDSNAGYAMKARGTGTALRVMLGIFHTASPYSADENYQLRIDTWNISGDYHRVRQATDNNRAACVLPVRYSGQDIDISEEEENSFVGIPLSLEFLEDGYLYWRTTNESQLKTTIKCIHYTEDDEPKDKTLESDDRDQLADTDGLVTRNRITVKAGDIIEFYGNTASTSLNNASHHNYFSSTAKFKAYGNVNSLLIAKPSDADLGDENYLATQCAKSLGNYALKGLFAATESGRAANLQEAENLVLPSTTLAESCYEGMFKGCSAIPQAPVLPATTGASNCYKEMFYGCSALSSITVNLTSPSSSYTSNWVNGVASGGDFYRNSTASWSAGNDGKPSAWTDHTIE